MVVNLNFYLSRDLFEIFNLKSKETVGHHTNTLPEKNKQKLTWCLFLNFWHGLASPIKFFTGGPTDMEKPFNIPSPHPTGTHPCNFDTKILQLEFKEFLDWDQSCLLLKSYNLK